LLEFIYIFNALYMLIHAPMSTFFTATVFTTEIQFDYNTVAGRIRELAFLNPKVWFCKTLLHYIDYVLC